MSLENASPSFAAAASPPVDSPPTIAELFAAAYHGPREVVAEPEPRLYPHPASPIVGEVHAEIDNAARQTNHRRDQAAYPQPEATQQAKPHQKFNQQTRRGVKR